MRVLDARNSSRRAAGALRGLAPGVPRALVGFDGFVDSIVHMVDSRVDMGPTGYTRLRTIREFADRCAAAAGRSTNIEQVLLEDRFGGNGPLLAGGLASLGASVVYAGAVASPEDRARVHPAFAEFASRCRRVVPLAQPSTTDCLEFDDGKLMFNNTANVQAVTWDRLVESFGEASLRDELAGADVVGIVNWSLLGGVEGIIRGLRGLMRTLPGKPWRVGVDLSDPAKRSDADIARMLDLLRAFEGDPGVGVTLGLNHAEALRIDAVAGAGAFASGGEETPSGAKFASASSSLRRALGLDCVVIHPRHGAAGAWGDDAAWIDGPFTRSPRLSTGAGDHFNAGFLLAQGVGLALPECLACAVGASGAYVRDARSPDRERLASFLEDLPAGINP